MTKPDANSAIDLFDEVAVQYDTVLPFFTSFAREFAALVPLGPKVRVLDLGAGRGALTGEALSRGCTVTAVDAAPAMLARLAGDHQGAAARVMDAHELDFPDDSFDVVVSGFVIHLLDSPEIAMREIRRVLAPGGVVAFSRPGGPPGFVEPADPDDPLPGVFRDFDAYLPPGRGRMGKHLDEPALLAEAGFSDISAHPISVDLPVPDGETYWQWSLSHGSAIFFQDLPSDRREEAHRRLVAETDALGGSFRLRRWATVWTGVDAADGGSSASACGPVAAR